MGSCESKKCRQKKKIGKRWADLRKLQWQRQRLLYFFMVTAMPGIIRNKNTNQPAAQVEKSTEEDNSQTVQVNQEMKYYLLLGTDGRTD